MPGNSDSYGTGLYGTGLVIGKFMPLHRGHIELIRFGAAHCRELIVLLGIRPEHVIPGHTRLQWLKETFEGTPNIRIEYTDEDLPESSIPSQPISRTWAEYVKKRFPRVEVIFSSEKYGDYMAGYMKVPHIPFDPGRERVNISASCIRENPFQYWDYLPGKVRPYFVRQVCIYGPESTGKSILTQYLAGYFRTVFVPEMAREYFGERSVDDVKEEDFLPIAILHAREILEKRHQANQLLFVDTDVITTRIYAQHYFGKAPDFPGWVMEANRFDHYLLLDIDVPWVADIARNSRHCRAEHFRWFKRELDDNGLPYTLIRGNWEQRNQMAVQAIKGLAVW